MIRKEYKYGADAREAIRKVAISLGDTLGKTLGPAGRNYQTPEGITNDGRAILSHVRFADECEDNVALAFHEIANRQDSDVGDGTTTGVVIGTKLTEDLVEKVPDLDAPTGAGMSVMDMSRELEKEKDKAIEFLKTKIVPVTTLEDLEKVAFTSMEDVEAAKIIAKTIFESGKDSHTTIEEGFSGKIETNIQAGIEAPIKLNLGTNVTTGESPVLVVNHLFEDYRELTPFMRSAVEFMNNNKVKFASIIIVAKKFSIPFIQRVSEVNRASGVQLVCMSNDHLTDEVFEDIAAFVDAKYIDTHPRGGLKISDVEISNCGFVSKFVATPKGAVFYGGNGTKLNPVKETTRVQARILQLRTQLEQETKPENRKNIEKRIAEFSGGKATIYVDAKTAVERYHLKLKVQDCVNSCQSALDEGMVRGGGLSLKEVADQLDFEENADRGKSALLSSALREPYRRIQQNAGGTLEIGEDVMDSYLVAAGGIKNAVSVVKTVLTLEGIIADHPQSMVEDLGKALNG